MSRSWPRYWHLLVPGLMATSACGDSSSMFSGTWELEGALDTPWLEGRPSLLIGHYGNELVGTILFNDSLGLLPQCCPCGFVEDARVDLDGEEFSAVTSACDESRIVWELSLEEDPDGEPILVGRAHPPEKVCASGECDVMFRLVERFVSEDDRQCDPTPDPQCPE